MTDQLRIAVGGISQETNTFSPLWTELEDFTVLRGDALLNDALDLSAVPGDVTLLPTVSASAQPGGIVRKTAFLHFKQAILEAIAALLPVDGIYLELHGAMEVEAIGSGEADLVAAVREVVGDRVLISVSLDLHGNVSARLVDNANLLTAYRTAPHRDGAATRQRALNLLLHALREDLRPVPALVKVPLLLAGEVAVTDNEPAKSLYARLADIDCVQGIMNASLLISCAWTDGAATSVSVIVVAEKERGLALEGAKQLAAEVWERRHDFAFDVEAAEVDDAIRRAMASAQRPVFISDSGDNVTAGGVGDRAYVAGRLLALGAQEALVAGLADAAAVGMCAAVGVGQTVQLTIGGTIDLVDNSALAVSGVVEHLTYENDDRAAPPAMALLRVGGVRIIVTRERRAFTDRASIAAAGIDPMAQKIVVVKLGYLFPDLAAHARYAIMALSAGTTDLRLAVLPYRRVPRPIYPLDPELAWQP
jgi:microcystin degradation protein MlrC